VEAPLKALKELVYFGSKGRGYISDNSALAKNLRENHPFLSTLFSSTLDGDLSIYSKLPLRRLLIRLTSNTKFDEYCKNVNIFKNVEELIIEDEESICDQELHSLAQSGKRSLMPCLKKVELPESTFAFLPRQTYMSITHLTIHASERRDYFLDLEDTISFPSLIYLRIDGSWAGLVHFDAPNVVELVLRIGRADKWDYFQYQNYEDFKGFSIFPQILRIDSLLPTAELPQLLDHNGKYVRELQITYFAPNLTASVPLTSALCGEEEKDPICPLLWKFEVITVQFKTRELYETTRGRLQQIAEARFSEGRFGKVRHASYPIGYGEWDGWKNIHVRSRRSLGFKWIELL
jgi:hypothetical protein